jgi:hypothetical protein
MFFLWYILHLLIIINYSISDQLCIDKCQFEYNLHSNFSLPSDCHTIRRDSCYVLTTFDYIKQTIKISFSLEPDRQDIENDYQTDNIIRSTINLEGTPFTINSVEYYCSTGDHCDLDYVENIAIPIYTPKSCEKFRSQLIQYLNPDPPTHERDCYINENTTLKCDLPCEFIYDNPDKISRSCEGDLDLMFETIIGESTPINKPEYHYRTWKFSCTTSLCNGKEMQQRIEDLIRLDDGECLSFFNQPNETTTYIPSKSTSTFSKSYYLIIFIICIFVSCDI